MRGHIKEYFESEMRLLQDAAQEFAEAYPEQAALLNLKAVSDRDPYVERLLEGMAFLTAQVRERIDDSVPELSENLIDQLNPALCRPFPSVAMIQFQVGEDNGETVHLDRHLTINSRPAGPDSIRCQFTTTSRIAVRPIRLADVKVEEQFSGGTRIILSLEKTANVAWSELDFTELRLYLHCDRPLAYALCEAATDRQARLTLRLDARARPDAVRLTPGLFDPDDALLPTEGRSHIAFNLLHDYFNAREKYFYLDITGFDSSDWPDGSERLEWVIDTPVTLPAGHRLDHTTFQLHTVPAVNLFHTEASPVRLTGKVPDYPLYLDPAYQGRAEIYSVTGVSGRCLETGESRDYRPLHALRYRHKQDPTYATYSRIVGNGRRRTHIAVSGADFGETAEKEARETLSVDVLASNVNYPRQYVEIGHIDSVEGAPTDSLEVRNITRPSRVHLPPAMHDFQWQLISMMSLNLSSLDDVDHLKTLLSLFDWSDQVENRNRIEAIERLRTDIRHSFREGTLVQLLDVRLEIQKSGFSSTSDLYLFGQVLHRFFTNFANITEAVRTTVVALPTYKEWVWEPNLGRRPVL